MPLVSYASAEDLALWVDGEPDPGLVDRLLHRATIEVARACNLTPYATPDATAVEPLRDATCLTAASWIALGLDPDKLGLDLPAPVKSSSILDAKVDRDTSGQSAAVAGAACELPPAAADLLLQAGLLWAPLPVGPANDYLPTYGLDSPRAYAWPAGAFTDGWPWP